MRSRSAARRFGALLTLGLLSCSASIEGPAAAQGVTVVVTPSYAALAPLAERTFAATVSGAVDASVTWAIAEGAAGGAVTANGAYRAPAATGTYHVVATSNADPTKTASATVLVTDGPGFSVSDTHPRLWWTAARLAQAQSWLASHPFTPGPTDTFYIAWKHVVAGTDCSPAIAWALSNTIPCYSPGNVGCDAARWYGENAFLVYDWCYDQLTPQQRSDFLSNVGGSGAGWNDYLAGINQQTWGGPAMTQSNYNWGNLRNDVELGIATFTENPMAETFLADGLTTRWGEHFVPTVDTCQAGGVGQEGTAYGSSMIPPVIPFATMRDGGRDILNETGFYKQFTYFVIYSTTPAATYNTGGAITAYQLSPFSDDELFVAGGILNQRSYYQDWMTFASNYWSGLDVGKHARQWVNTVGAHPATKATSRFTQAHDSSPAAASYASLPLDSFATGVQYLYGRKAWDTSSTYFLWQLGHPQPCAGVGHVHADVGNFNLWRGGRWLARETTGYSNTITGYGYRNTPSEASESMLAHNGILFGTPLATWGPLLPTVTDGQTVVRRLESSPGYAYADVDLTERYLWDAGHASLDVGAAVHVERELLFLRDLETTLILDRLTTGNVTQGPDMGKAAADVVNTFLLHLETNPTLEDATHLTATNGTQALRVTTLVPSNPTRRVVNEQSCAGCSAGIGQYRVELDTSGAAQRYFLHALQARDAGGSNVTATVVDSNPADPGAGTFTVTLHPSTGADTVVVFNKGQTSSGGTVNLAGSGAKALAAGAQKITYTDSGPVWTP